MKKRGLRPNALGYDIALSACESSSLASPMPGLLRKMRASGLSAAAVAGDAFEEEDAHGEHSGLAVVALDALGWHGAIDAELRAGLWARLCAPSLERLRQLCCGRSVAPGGRFDSAAGGALREPLLERHSCLGDSLTAVVLADLGP
ncbi:unnamed protein product [Polarella glacialis]|uniref:Uncharacterized protein n=1 Tax=Polarella glacialis TaxID=89957 RepID=A0A813JSM3_POLGL|nr:unnamed protein product [Polarella glacialis]